MGTTVTIDKSYFETLLRRAEFHVSGSGQDLITPLDLPTVNILKVDHENLLRMVHEYMCLRDALYRGGVDPQTLEVLIRGDQGSEPAPTYLTNFKGRGNRALPGDQSWITPTRKHASSAKAPGNAFDFGRATETAADKPQMDQHKYHQHHSNAGNDNIYSTDDVEKDENVSPCNPKSDPSSYPKAEKYEQRSIIFKNLSDRTTHQDLVHVVRGGLLLDVHLRSQDKSAIVSFAQGSAAQEFFAYVRRNDVYIHGRRITFAWCDRQYVLPGDAANKIRIGATRNLVIRRLHPHITEKSLRDDLDHIHNLVIISLSFEDGDAYLSLNSVRNSLFARSCMMSRAKYKGLMIEWYPDECASPLPKMHNGYNKKEKAPPLPKPKETPMMNRFQMLNMEDDDDADDAGPTEAGSSFGEDDDRTVTSGFSSLRTSRRTPWDLQSAAA